MISQMTPAGASPARRARSTAASVCPSRSRTPSGRARSGKTWPGRRSWSARVAGSISAWIVRARSAAEMPVLPSTSRSTETVNAVSSRPATSGTMGPRPSASRRSPVIGAQTSPRPTVTIVLMWAAVTSSAAPTRSPSFSRSTSSTTMMSSPRARAARASSIVDSPAAMSASVSSGRGPPSPVTASNPRLAICPRTVLSLADPPTAERRAVVRWSEQVIRIPNEGRVAVDPRSRRADVDGRPLLP